MQKLPNDKKFSFTTLLWDLFCSFSIVGIWPRFIEPKLLFTACKSLALPDLPKDLENFKILQFSDLHLNAETSPKFLDKIVNRINALKPELIVFTGDFICYGQTTVPHRLTEFLNRLKAPYGCYAVPGNHDYNEYITINQQGEYDLAQEPKCTIIQGLMRLTTKTTLAGYETNQARHIELNTKLITALKQTSFKLLDNQTTQIKVGNAHLNITGLGEHMAGRVNPTQAFANYDARYPGITLLHNPDGIAALKDTPGQVILCGHTHGGQINLPFLWKKFCILENLKYKRGGHRTHSKWIYINRGVGGTLPFRWFAPPEILLLTLVKG